MFRIKHCAGCGESLNQVDIDNFNGFCKKCFDNGWHYCEKCGKPIYESKEVLGNGKEFVGLMCNDCVS